MLSVMSIITTVIDAVLGIIGLLLILRLLLRIFKVPYDQPVLKLLRTVTDPILKVTNKWLGIPTYQYSLPSLQSELASIIAALIVIWAGRTLLVSIFRLVTLIPIWIMNPLPNLYAILSFFLNLIFELYSLALYVRVLLSWVRVSAYGKVTSFLYKITEPLLAPIRQIMPSFGGIDFSPIIAVLILQFLQRVMLNFLVWIF